MLSKNLSHKFLLTNVFFEKITEILDWPTGGLKHDGYEELVSNTKSQVLNILLNEIHLIKMN